ncbi:hypothetical protein BT93_F0957 [Corymbia citriodora subsp. variegata]|nr:hypothetical protein BT93_F0957 [Corymbia citriodora subsp. variegata]
MGMESAASSVRKKPRILVQKWLKEIERARYNFQIIDQANVETLPPKVQVETLTREVEGLTGRTLPHKLLREARDAKGDAFLERKLIDEAIHRNIELIWDRLKENHACKFGICGMGGVGKTTIMMHIHNRLLKDATFDGVAFITVSQDFSNYKLQSDIWKALKFAKLSKRLERKKSCVLILDDVWERIDLEEVGIPIKSNGFKLVLTTRSYDVCCQMQCEEEIKIKPLSQNEVEILFLEELGSEVALDLETQEVVESIVRECAGLPIAIITMARSMRGVTDMFEWRDSLVKLKESCMGQIDMEKKVLMKLKFSYDRLGDYDVQQCFLSCALYPEDELINRFELVEFFIDQGLIGGLNSRKEQYDRGFTILKRLGSVFLLETHTGWMKMHDLIRDMALHIMGATSIVSAGKQLVSLPPEEYWTDALEKVSLMKNKTSEFPLNMSPNCPKLSTILLNGNWLKDIVSIPDSFFRQFCGLKVLNLSGCRLRELPNSISNLVNLRALLLSWCSELRHIPYLGKLTSLRKLDTKGCENLEALKGLGTLMNLRYLALGFSMSHRLPKGVLGGLLNLQHLKVGTLDEEDITKLRALETLECYFEDADDFNKCVRLLSRRCSVEDKMKSSLNISQCPKLKYLFGHGSISNLPHLRQIQIGRCEEMVGIIATVTPPPPHPLPAFPSLERIFIHWCGKMKRAVESEWLHHFPNMRTIDVSYCEKMDEIIGAGQGQEGSIMTPVNNTHSSFQSSISLPNLRELKLCDLPQLKSIYRVPISCCSMEELRVYDCPELKAIPLQLRLRDIDIEDLPHIWVEDEEKWKTLMWDDPNAQAILQPYLRKGEYARDGFPWTQCPPNAIG